MQGHAKLEPPIPGNYFDNYVWGHFVDADPLDFIKEEAIFYLKTNVRFARCMFCHKSVLVPGCMILFFATYMSLHENIELNCENINKLCLVGVVRYETYIKS